ncbi:MAG: S-methyl-5-thioribose-1-phosphate isomerase [Candidatus Gygaella obscura]|nr:S-methyl-5-thioribose-1-phosphate isomerase [Candidatus Gygaella obscura]
MKIQTIKWHKGVIRIIDQTKLPGRLSYVYIANVSSLVRAIKTMKIRGAPALGAAAGLGIYLGVKDIKTSNHNVFSFRLKQTAKLIAGSRPTARNLFWAIEGILDVAKQYRQFSIQKIKQEILKKALLIVEQDRKVCRAIGQYGEKLIKNNYSILTICNAGILATVDYGTSLAAIYSAKTKRKKFKVYACETRPVLQGARLTAWELNMNKIDVTLICDNMAASLMQQGEINMVIVGADRIAANADTANKIGTYNLAVLASYHKVPFYIAAPSSTFDFSIKSGKDIIIEQRANSEVTKNFFKKPIAPNNIKVYNPAFDVTPHKLITAIITEVGIIKNPFKNLKQKIHEADSFGRR